MINHVRLIQYISQILCFLNLFFFFLTSNDFNKCLSLYIHHGLDHREFDIYHYEMIELSISGKKKFIRLTF